MGSRDWCKGAVMVEKKISDLKSLEYLRLPLSFHPFNQTISDVFIFHRSSKIGLIVSLKSLMQNLAVT